MITIAFTGHRPDKLDGYQWNTVPKELIKCDIQLEIYKILSEYPFEPVTFVFGGALGIDQMAFDIVNRIKSMHLRDDCDDWILEVAVPFEHQDVIWSQTDKTRYRKQLELADIITYVDTLTEYGISTVPIGEYDNMKLQRRNRYMVDKCDILIAVWNGTKGGTANCVRYANSKSKKVIRINPNKHLTNIHI